MADQCICQKNKNKNKKNMTNAKNLYYLISAMFGTSVFVMLYSLMYTVK